MQGGYTHIAVILDRSGSMEDIREDTIEGFNAFLETQQRIDGRATLTLVQFDSIDPYEVLCRLKPVEEVRPLTRQMYVPRGGTPLLDSLGTGITDLQEHLAELPEDAWPDRVIFVVITDGQENASKQFTKRQIQEMICSRQEACGWQFVFLSADFAAIEDALTTGVHPRAAMLYDKSGAGATSAWRSLANRISDVRSSRSALVEFTDEDRAWHRGRKPRSRRS